MTIEKLTGNALFTLHVALVLLSLVGLFGKLVTLPPPVLVWGRALSAAGMLYILLRLRRRSLRLPNRKTYAVLIATGVLLAIHWSTFFHAIALSSVVIGLLAVPIVPIILVFLEPLWFHTRISAGELALASIGFAGIVITIPAADFANATTQGIFWALVSAVGFAVVAILNRTYVQRHSSLLILFYQTSVVSVVLLPAAVLIPTAPTIRDVTLVVLLGSVFTAFGHSLLIHSLRQLSAQRVALIGNLVPVYGALAAAVLLGEIPTPRTIFGGSIILATAVATSMRTRGISLRLLRNRFTP